MSFEPRTQQSTAQHSTAQQRNLPYTKQQTKYVPIRVHIERSMYVHACCVPSFFWSMSSWHLKVACVHLKSWTIYFIYYICLSFQPMLRERA